MLKIIYLGHACVKIINDDFSIIIDPYKDESVPGINLPNDLSSNFLFISHEHFDHNAREKVKIIPIDYKLNYSSFSIPHDKHNGKDRGFTNVNIFNINGYSIAHLGDIGTLDNHELDKLMNIDIVLCPINGFYTINAKEAILLQKKYNIKTLIPIHYYDPKKLSGYLDNDEIHTFIKESTILKEVNNSLEINSETLSFKQIIINI